MNRTVAIFVIISLGLFFSALIVLRDPTATMWIAAVVSLTFLLTGVVLAYEARRPTFLTPWWRTAALLGCSATGGVLAVVGIVLDVASRQWGSLIIALAALVLAAVGLRTNWRAFQKRS